MPNVEFKAYYGFSNMLKLGKKDHVDAIQQMFNERPWATMVGSVDQTKLIEELAQAKVWLYPTNFAETFCISALEAVCSKVYPVVRHFGALPHTLTGLPGALIQRDCLGEDIRFYAERVIDALKTEKWKEMDVSPERFSWQSVALEWVEIMGL
jgi:glycosyltransferase involved in cell wall biosynthesis